MLSLKKILILVKPRGCTLLLLKHNITPPPPSPLQQKLGHTHSEVNPGLNLGSQPSASRSLFLLNPSVPCSFLHELNWAEGKLITSLCAQGAVIAFQESICVRLTGPNTFFYPHHNLVTNKPTWIPLFSLLPQIHGFIFLHIISRQVVKGSGIGQTILESLWVIVLKRPVALNNALKDFWISLNLEKRNKLICRWQFAWTSKETWGECLNKLSDVVFNPS